MENTRDTLYLQEFERRRIAEGLHDTTAQELICLAQRMELACLYMDQDPVLAKLEVMSAKRQIKSIIRGLRETIYDLRPMAFDDIGCGAAFRELHEKLSRKNLDIRVSFEIDDLDQGDGVVAISIYRIVCEACQNILKHSGAENMWVRLESCKDHIKLMIRDDGIGFQNQEEDGHFGMEFMREKVFLLSGTMHVETGSGGTVILIEIPWECDGQRHEKIEKR